MIYKEKKIKINNNQNSIKKKNWKTKKEGKNKDTMRHINLS